MALDVNRRRALPRRAKPPPAAVAEVEEFRGAETDFRGAAVDDAAPDGEEVAVGVQAQLALDAHAAVLPGLEQTQAFAQWVAKLPGVSWRRQGNGVGSINLHGESNVREGDRDGFMPNGIPSAARGFQPDGQGAIR